jgi:hypothetical protein
MTFFIGAALEFLCAMTPEKNQSSKRLQSGFIENLNGAVRENPMAAALIGVGVSWMFFRGSRITDFGLANASQKVTGAVGSKVQQPRKLLRLDCRPPVQESARWRKTPARPFPLRRAMRLAPPRPSRATLPSVLRVMRRRKAAMTF